MRPMNTMFHILYRDAHNYKAIGGATVAGFDPDAISRIEAALDEGQFFIPRQVGLERPRFTFGRKFDPEVDHPWCELTLEATDRNPTDPRTIFELADAFEAVKWDEAHEDLLLRGGWS